MSKSNTPDSGNPSTAILREFSDSRGMKPVVDRERGIVQGVKVLGLESKNRRVYPKETVARAMALYEGSKVNVNHPAGNSTDPRDYRDRIGVLRGVRMAEGDRGLYADFHFNPKHALAEQLLWDAENAPENVGFSHNVEARVTRRDGKIIVEEIRRVLSVDLVADPATTRGLFEGEDHTGNKNMETIDMEKITLEQLRAERADIVESIAKSAVESYLQGEEAKAKDAQLKALTEQVDEFKTREALAAKKAKIDGLLEEAKLPKEAITETFRKSLEDAKDEAAVKELIEDRKALVGSVRPNGQPPRSREQGAGGSGGPLSVPDTKSFVESIAG